MSGWLFSGSPFLELVCLGGALGMSGLPPQNIGPGIALAANHSIVISHSAAVKRGSFSYH
jgi:hypothetical protein